MELIVSRIATYTEGKNNKISALIEYNLETKVASVYSEETEELIDESSVVFTKDIKRVVKLAIKEADFYQGKVNNNKVVIGISEGKELEKANRHLAKNQAKLDFIHKFIVEQQLP